MFPINHLSQHVLLGAVSLVISGFVSSVAWSLPPSSAHIEIDGKKITDSELPFGTQQQLYEMNDSAYKAKLNIYHNYLFQTHVRTLAAQQKKSVEMITSQLLKVTEPTDKELQAFFNEDPYLSNQYDFQAIKSHLKTNVIQSKQQKIKQALVDELKKTHSFRYLDLAPQPPVAQISLAKASIKGAQTAPVTVVKFSDFYCSKCREMSFILAKILADKTYKNKVKMMYAPFAVFGDKATVLASQAYCAGEQNKFWDFHDKIFAFNSSELSSAKADEVIKDISLNTKKLAQCMASKESSAFVESSKQEGTKLGVSGTPTLYVNGIKVLSLSEDALRKALDSALAQSS